MLLFWNLVILFTLSESTEWRSNLTTSELSVLHFHSGNRLSQRLTAMIKSETEKLEKNTPPILVKQFNCSNDERDVCDEFGIEKTPVIKLYKKGDFLKNYEGRKEASPFRKYVRKLVGPLITQLGNEDDLNLLLKTRYNTVVCFCRLNSPVHDIFQRVARDKADLFNFAVYEGTFSSYNASQNSIILIRPKLLQSKFEPIYLTYSSDANEKTFSNWLNENKYGLFHIRTKDNYQEFSAPLITAYMFIHEARISDFKFWRNRLLKVSIEFLDRFYFAINDLEDFYQDLDTFGQFLNPSEAPIVCLMASNHLRFPMIEEFTVDNYRKFLKQLTSRGKNKVYLQSDQSKPEDDRGPVRRVVGSRFVEMVIKNDRDTFLLICLPPMTSCDEIESVWTELATGRLKDESIEFLTLDMKNNSWSHFYLFEGHPTVYWAGRYNKTKPFLYLEDLTADAFFYFIAERSTDELRGFDRKGQPKPKKDEL